MTLQLIPFIFFIVCAIAFKFSKRKKHQIWFFLAFFFSVGIYFVPSGVWGKWNLLKPLKDKRVTKVIISPIVSDYDVNIVDTLFEISNNLLVDTLTNMFKNVLIYSPAHPSRIWETNITFITTEKDSLKFNVWKIRGDKTIIYKQNRDVYLNNELAGYLEHLVNFKIPIMVKHVTKKF